MFQWITENLSAFWFAIGFALLAIEIVAFGLGSGVLLFGSLGALLTGIVFWAEFLPETWLNAIAAFAVLTALATAALWVPLKRMQSGAELGNNRSSDLIGRRFRLESDIDRGLPGTTRYSGVQWRVELSEESALESLEQGVEVSVVSVNAGVFYVAQAAGMSSSE